MTIRIQADHYVSGPACHRWFPDGKFGTLNLGGEGLLNALYFDSTDDLDVLIAEAVALRAEIAAADTAVPHCGARWPNRGPAGGRWTCTLDKDHDGDHEAGTPGDGRPFYSSAPQDDDEVTWDETPASVTS